MKRAKWKETDFPRSITGKMLGGNCGALASQVLSPFRQYDRSASTNYSLFHSYLLLQFSSLVEIHVFSEKVRKGIKMIEKGFLVSNVKRDCICLFFV